MTKIILNKNIKLGTKLPDWVRNGQTGYEMTKMKIKNGYEMTKMVRNDLGTK